MSLEYTWENVVCRESLVQKLCDDWIEIQSMIPRKVTYSYVQSFPVSSRYAATPTIATPIVSCIFFKKLLIAGPDLFVATLCK